MNDIIVKKIEALSEAEARVRTIKDQLRSAEVLVSKRQSDLIKAALSVDRKKAAAFGQRFTFVTEKHEATIECRQSEAFSEDGKQSEEKEFVIISITRTRAGWLGGR